MKQTTPNITLQDNSSMLRASLEPLTAREQLIWDEARRIYRSVVKKPLKITLCRRKIYSKLGVAAARYLAKTNVVIVWHGFIKFLLANMSVHNAKLYLLTALLHEHGHSVVGIEHDDDGLMSATLNLHHDPGAYYTKFIVLWLAGGFNERYKNVFNIERLTKELGIVA